MYQTDLSPGRTAVAGEGAGAASENASSLRWTKPFPRQASPSSGSASVASVNARRASPFRPRATGAAPLPARGRTGRARGGGALEGEAEPREGLRRMVRPQEAHAAGPVGVEVVRVPRVDDGNAREGVVEVALGREAHRLPVEEVDRIVLEDEVVLEGPEGRPHPAPGGGGPGFRLKGGSGEASASSGRWTRWRRRARAIHGCRSMGSARVAASRTSRAASDRSRDSRGSAFQRYASVSRRPRAARRCGTPRA